MPNRFYETGYRFEQRVKKHYESRGWFCVRSAGSHSPCDIVALKHHPPATDVVLIQCKVGKPTRKDVLELYGLANRLNVVAVIVSRDAKGKLVKKDVEELV